MIFSYTQISQYLACPRRYRFRYLDGWEESVVRAPMVFGRVFEGALAAHLRSEDAFAVFRRGWEEQREAPLEYGAGDSWAKCASDGERLLELFGVEQRITVAEPSNDLQVKVERRLAGRDSFVGYLDAIASLDGVRTIIDWKTTSSSYPTTPPGLAALDPQLICYSWLTSIEQVALVVFVRKKTPEIQYLIASVSAAQRTEFGRMVEAAVASIRQSRFEQKSGIRFPSNPCLGCPYLGFCLGKPNAAAQLHRRTDLEWLDQLCA